MFTRRQFLEDSILTATAALADAMLTREDRRSFVEPSESEV